MQGKFCACQDWGWAGAGMQPASALRPDIPRSGQLSTQVAAPWLAIFADEKTLRFCRRTDVAAVSGVRVDAQAAVGLARQRHEYGCPQRAHGQPLKETRRGRRGSIVDADAFDHGALPVAVEDPTAPPNLSAKRLITTRHYLAPGGTAGAGEAPYGSCQICVQAFGSNGLNA